jgi:hypothetical protein
MPALIGRLLMDDDLAEMDRDQLVAEVKRLRNAARAHFSRHRYSALAKVPARLR